MLTRFAPSPTGFLHLGNVRTALICWLYAKREKGEFLLRIDDTDLERSKEEYVTALQEDLQWLGLDWQHFARQSDRFDSYRKAIDALIKAGRLYPAYETAEELDIKRKMQLSRGAPPIYDRAAYKLTDAQKKEFEAQGRKPHYRFLMKENEIAWDDKIKGRIAFQGKHISDPILMREDGSFTYMMPSTVDDIELGITHIVRGEDHVTNTAIQIQIFEALGAKIPVFAHLALIKTAEGKLSKREGSFSVRALREAGIEPMAVSSFLAKVGTSQPIEIRSSLEELVNEFNLDSFNKAPTFYAVEDLERLNAKLFHQLSYTQIASRLGNIPESFWLSVRANITKLEEAQEWWRICNEALQPVIEDQAYTEEAARYLPEGTWDDTTWDQWIAAIKEKTGRKGKPLFMPLRLALTAMEHGPELKALLPLMKRDTVIARLKGKRA